MVKKVTFSPKVEVRQIEIGLAEHAAEIKHPKILMKNGPSLPVNLKNKTYNNPHPDSNFKTVPSKSTTPMMNKNNNNKENIVINGYATTNASPITQFISKNWIWLVIIGTIIIFVVILIVRKNNTDPEGFYIRTGIPEFKNIKENNNKKTKKNIAVE